MNQKLIASALAVLLVAGSVTTNFLTFSAFANLLNFQPVNLFSPSKGSSEQKPEDKGPTPVDLRNLGSGVVPDMVGLALSDAKQLETLSGFDFTFYEESSTGSLSEIASDQSTSTDLFVCKQALPGGAELNPDDAPFEVEVVASLGCKDRTNDFLVGKAKVNASTWEPIRPTDETKNVVQGWVYGFAGEDENQKLVQVMTYSGVQDFELAMIDLVGTSGCDMPDAEWSTYIQQALDSKHAKLPIGKPVSAVLDWLEYVKDGNEAFMHLLDPSTGQYLVEPPKESVNEALVRDGYWVPAGDHITLGPEYVAQKKQKWTSADSYLTLNKLGKEYRKLIVKAGNTMRKHPQVTLATCIAYETKIFIKLEGGVDVRWKYGIPGGYMPPGCTWVDGYWRSTGWVNGYVRCG